MHPDKVKAIHIVVALSKIERIDLPRNIEKEGYKNSDIDSSKSFPKRTALMHIPLRIATPIIREPA